MAQQDGAVYWSAQMPLLVEQRKEIPDVDRLQRCYVRYSTDARGTHVEHGWTKHQSLQAQQDLSEPDRAQVEMQHVPEALSMEIIRAPAEFAVPVKQDRRLKPPFKVRVTVWHNTLVSLPVTVTAHAVTDEEYADLENWIPPALDAAVTGEMVDRATPTELKGSVQCSHTFELAAPSGTSMGGGASTLPGSLHLPDHGFGSGSSDPGLAFSGSQADSPYMDALSAPVQCRVNNDHRTLDKDHGWHGTMMALQSLVQEQDMRQKVGKPATRGLEAIYAHAGPSGEVGGLFANPAAGAAFGLSHPGRSGHPAPPAACSAASHEFDFDKLEFARPSRMNKVYIVFSAQVSNVDILYTVFEVPTICFCRREQKERAYKKLGVPYRAGPAPAVKPKEAASKVIKVKRELGEGGMTKKQRAGMSNALRTSLPGHTGSTDPFSGPWGFTDMAASNGTAGADHDFAPGAFGFGVTEAQVREYIEERYHASALPRPLTTMDKDALLELAGFPQMGPSNSQPVITHEQFAEFQTGWDQICKLLTKIRQCWIADDPHVICGFELDHATAVGALRDQPPGTFLCRFSLSQPGNMVLVCKVPPQSPNADSDSLVHGLLNVIDLRERRVDAWINDFPGATHLLDVYSNKRVDKRRAFPSQYTRLEYLQELHHSTPYGYCPDQPAVSHALSN